MSGRIDEFGHVDNGMFAEDYIKQLEAKNKRLREIAQDLLHRLNGARPESIGRLNSHRSVRYSWGEMADIQKVLKGGGE